MAVEIELKARLDDFEPVRERLFVMGEYCRAYIKSDTYWLPAQQAARQLAAIPSGVRVRRESGVNADGAAFGTILVTYKTKEITDGIEINDESEFIVSDAPVFEELLGRLGLHPAHRKEKKGWAWLIAPPQAAAQQQQAVAQRQPPPILAELSLVEGLGWFLEIEIQAADNHQQTVDESRRRLFALLEQLKIPADQIESRPYTLMLEEAKLSPK
jgi:adenylate cyclase class 2